MQLPSTIPSGARIVVRIVDGTNPATGRQQYRDFVGHVQSWDGQTLHLQRDATANGNRPAYDVHISAQEIVALKPVPERPNIH